LSLAAHDTARRGGDHRSVPAALSAIVAFTALLAFVGLLGHRG
jgi:hypothetical protein